MIVLDTSAAVSVLLNQHESTPRIREKMNGADDGCTCRTSSRMSALRSYALGNALSSERASLALSRLSTMRITRYPHTAPLLRVWELRENVTAYDATYIALAETLEATLATRDERLTRAPGIRAAVEVYG